MPYSDRLFVVAGVLLVTAIVAKLVDRALGRRDLDPKSVTRYRVLRRSVISVVVGIGVLSALLVIPQVQAVAGGILASSAVIGLVIGFAARSTLANFVAGLLIAFTQPLRIGDEVEVGGDAGTVEEIGLTYTFIRMLDGVRLVIPNEKLASDTIRNSTIVSREKLAEVNVQVPLDKDLGAVVDLLRTELVPAADVLVTEIADRATVTLRTPAADAREAERVASDLRLRAHSRLLAAGLLP